MADFRNSVQKNESYFFLGSITYKRDLNLQKNRSNIQTVLFTFIRVYYVIWGETSSTWYSCEHKPDSSTQLTGFGNSFFYSFKCTAQLTGDSLGWSRNPSKDYYYSSSHYAMETVISSGRMGCKAPKLPVL